MRREGHTVLGSGSLARRAATASVILGAGLHASCKKEEPVNPMLLAPAASASAPADRLAPGELGPSEQDLFGLRVPRGMDVQGKFKDFAIATGNVGADAVANYVRDHVAVERVEIGAARTIFPAARIKDGPAERIFRIEVLTDGRATRLTVRDITPPPLPPSPPVGVSSDELWRRAGFSRDGKPLDTKALE